MVASLLARARTVGEWVILQTPAPGCRGSWRKCVRNWCLHPRQGEERRQLHRSITHVPLPLLCGRLQREDAQKVAPTPPHTSLVTDLPSHRGYHVDRDGCMDLCETPAQRSQLEAALASSASGGKCGVCKKHAVAADKAGLIITWRADFKNRRENPAAPLMWASRRCTAFPEKILPSPLLPPRTAKQQGIEDRREGTPRVGQLGHSFSPPSVIAALTARGSGTQNGARRARVQPACTAAQRRAWMTCFVLCSRRQLRKAARRRLHSWPSTACPSTG